MDLNKIKAIAVEIQVDEQLLNRELELIPDDKWSKHQDHYSGHEWKNIFLTKNNVSEFNDFKTAKSITHDEWFWDDTLDIPYIKNLVESLPLTHVGMVRAFILSGPLVMHVDSNEQTPDDPSYKMGLTIATKLESPMLLDKTIISEKNVLFDDSVEHGFPNGSGTQISIRVFGDFDYDKFKITKIYER